MARFRKARKRYFGKKGSYRGHKSSGFSMTDVLLAGAIYGAVRPTVSGMLPTFFKIGVVDSDSVILGAASYFAMKSNNKLIKSIGVIGLGTEAGIITSQLMQPSSSSKPSNLTYDNTY